LSVYGGGKQKLKCGELIKNEKEKNKWSRKRKKLLI